MRAVALCVHLGSMRQLPLQMSAPVVPLGRRMATRTHQLRARSVTRDSLLRKGKLDHVHLVQLVSLLQQLVAPALLCAIHVQLASMPPMAPPAAHSARPARLTMTSMRRRHAHSVGAEHSLDVVRQHAWSVCRVRWTWTVTHRHHASHARQGSTGRARVDWTVQLASRVRLDEQMLTVTARQGV